MNALTSTFLIIILAVSLLVYIINIYNKLVMMKNNVEKAFANIDVVLKQRTDEIPNLVSVVKSYMTYENELLIRLMELRSSYTASPNSDQSTIISNMTTSALTQVFATSENYPQLQANKNF